MLVLAKSNLGDVALGDLVGRKGVALIRLPWTRKYAVFVAAQRPFTFQSRDAETLPRDLQKNKVRGSRGVMQLSDSHVLDS